MAAEGMQFPWRWTSGAISQYLGVIWEMSVQGLDLSLGSSNAERDIDSSKAPATVSLTISIKKY